MTNLSVRWQTHSADDSTPGRPWSFCTIAFGIYEHGEEPAVQKAGEIAGAKRRKLYADSRLRRDFLARRAEIARLARDNAGHRPPSRGGALVIYRPEISPFRLLVRREAEQ